MGVAVLIETAEPVSVLRREFAERICAAWHKSREKIIALGRALIEARQKLPAGEFTAMVERDLPFQPWTARQFMRIASDPRNVARATVLPETARAMDELGKLNDLQFEAAIAKGEIHEQLTVREAQQIVRDYIHVSHRPLAVASHKAPALAKTAEPESWDEIVALLKAARGAAGFSQAYVDNRVGWAEALLSKLEIPHREAGRVPGAATSFEWLQGIEPLDRAASGFLLVHRPLLRGLLGYVMHLTATVKRLQGEIERLQKPLAA